MTALTGGAPNPIPGKACDQLVGRVLVGGWTVTELIVRSPGSTGGHFSTSYKVKNVSGQVAFLKALDFSAALSSADPAQELLVLTSHFVFEREMLNECVKRGLDRIVRLIGSGTDTGGAVPVPYLILEMADGDIRDHLDTLTILECAWALEVLHQVAVGLQQLHGLEAAHQDLKPSNVLEFDGQKEARIGDLGRASRRLTASPFDDLDVAGDLQYAPPELLYGQFDPDWRRRRFSYDMYLFGSLIVFVFSRVSMSGLLFSQLPANLHFTTWSETYVDVLPFVRSAFNDAIDLFAQSVPDALRSEVEQMVRELCEPDPSFRGHPKNRIGKSDQFSLERYVSKLNFLASRVETGLIVV